MSANNLGPYIYSAEHFALLRYVLAMKPSGIALEFGVGSGQSLRLIAAHMPVVGFDSFEGLPEDWREGYAQGMFACEPPEIDDNATLVVGLFEDTLPAFTESGKRSPIGLIHCDCDLYESTKTVFDHLGPWIDPGCLIVFDEFRGYPDAEQYEQRAWNEYVERTGTTYEPVAHSFQQVAVRIT